MNQMAVSGMTMNQQITIDENALAAICRKHGISKLSLFGSVLREDFHDESDIDILVEFEPRVAVGFFKLGEIEAELTALMGRTVDLRTPAELSPYFRDEVVENASVQYAQG